jgi:hypothetical protein
MHFHVITLSANLFSLGLLGLSASLFSVSLFLSLSASLSDRNFFLDLDRDKGVPLWLLLGEGKKESTDARDPNNDHVYS